MEKEFAVRPIGFVKSARDAAIDDDWDAVQARIEIDFEEIEPSALLGLDTFSHIEIVYLFDRVDPAKICCGARHPRGRKDWPLAGILAQRAKDRPNRLGVTACRLTRIEGNVLHVQGLDAIDGTPVLDIKPVMRGFLPRGEIREPQWADELMAGYWK